ncbi:MAG: FAD-dependent oxidoreductase [Myxococcales bacterium]|nr:MAG: FAD-dependent oxidoreductase [Myxococcales bacterium]
MTARVVVIGRGLAGTIAALAAREKGAAVTLVARAHGRTALSSGLLALADPSRLTSDTTRTSLPEALRRVMAALPHHPFHQFSDPMASLRQGARLLLSAAPQLFSAPLDETVLPRRYPNEWGTAANIYLAPHSFAWLDDALFGDAPALLAGLSGYPRFRAAFISKALSAFHLPSGRLAKIEAISIPFDRAGGLFHHPGQLAGMLDDPSALERLAEAIRAALKGRSASIVLFPPVLGLNRLDGAAALAKLLDRPVYELAATHVSVPGLRLAQCLSDALKRTGVDLVAGEALGGVFQGKKLTGIKIRRPGGEERSIAADAVVLATGKYLGGGIVHSNHRFGETVFDLPLSLGGRRVAEAHIGYLTDADFLAPQKFARLGVAVEASMRPANEQGEAVYANVFAAGQILGGFDPTLDGSADGVDLATGFAAGSAAAEAAG